MSLMIASASSSGDAALPLQDLGVDAVNEPAAEPLDSHEERELAELQRKRREHVIEVLGETLSGTVLWNVFVRGTWITSLSTLGYGIYAVPDLAIERRGFLAMGVAYIAFSILTLTKTIRDREEARKLELAVRLGIVPSLGSQGTVAALDGRREWLLAAVGSWITSLGVTLFGIFKMPLPTHLRMFLLMGLVSNLSTTITLAKQIRDQEDSIKWRGLSTKTKNECSPQGSSVRFFLR